VGPELDGGGLGRFASPAAFGLPSSSPPSGSAAPVRAGRAIAAGLQAAPWLDWPAPEPSSPGRSLPRPPCPGPPVPALPWTGRSSVHRPCPGPAAPGPLSFHPAWAARSWLRRPWACRSSAGLALARTSADRLWLAPTVGPSWLGRPWLPLLWADLPWADRLWPGPPLLRLISVDRSSPDLPWPRRPWL